MTRHDGRVVSNFIVQALAGQDLTICGDGQQTRSFCYVDELVEGLIRLMDTDDAVTGPVNLGNPDEFTILELAEKVLEITAARSRMVLRPLPEDDPVQRRPDIRLARSLMNWNPTIPLDRGLRMTLPYFAGRMGALAA